MVRYLSQLVSVFSYNKCRILLRLLFSDSPNVRNGSDAFIVKGFDNWKKVNDGKNCAFLKYIGCLQHRNDVANVVLENAPYNAKYTSGLIQKEILSIIADNVRKHIRREVGDSYFYVMVDEARDESKEEQMAIVLRFIDKDGFIRERFLYLVHVYDTMAVTLKANLWKQLLNYEFGITKIRSQGYDGASNMRGEWNGLQALVAKDFYMRTMFTALLIDYNLL
ncbi:zinc finger MYM-type protein 1-like protein [Tanacetum coccineum]